MRTNTSILHLFSGKGACVRDVLDKYRHWTPGARRVRIRSPLPEEGRGDEGSREEDDR